MKNQRRENTDLQGLKLLAKVFLSYEPVKTKFSPMIVKHPFTDSGIVGIRTDDGGYGYANLLDNQADMDNWREHMEKRIDSIDDASGIFILITKPYALGFFKHAAQHLGREDFAKILAHTWIRTEAPNSDPNLSKSKLLTLFKSADPQILMDEEEYQQFLSLPDKVTVYRGVTSYNASNVKALSWTLDRKTAEWFAQRFGEYGTVYQAVVDKQHIFALFTGRNESEVIVNPKYLEGLEQIHQFAPSEQTMKGMEL